MPNRIFEQDELFHRAGPEESLDYLWGRLQDRDLSGEEALALLSAVHRQLSTARAGDPSVYLAYARFMESLSREMPLVHDYVVAHWIENRRSSLRQPRQRSDSEPDIVDEDTQAAEQSDPAATAPRKAAASFPPLTSIGGGSADEPGEAGEPEEADDAEGGPQARAGTAEAEPDGHEEDVSDADEGAVDDESDSSDADESEVLTEQEEGSEAEAAEADPVGEDAEQVAEQEAEPESGEGGQPTEQDADEGDPGEAGEAPTAEQPEAEEGEWPAEEQPEPPEPTEEMEGEGDEPSPEE